MNARSIETEKLLQEGLVKTMLKKPYNTISVSDIVKEVNLNRTTFYCHYSNIDELYKEISETIMEKSIDVFLNGEKGIEDFLIYVKENKDSYRALLLNPGFSDFMNQFSKKMMDEALRLSNDNIQNKKLYYSYSFYGSIGMVRQWMESDFKLDVKQLANIINQVSNSIVKTARKMS